MLHYNITNPASSYVTIDSGRRRLTCSEFEKEAGSKRKHWKMSFKVHEGGREHSLLSYLGCEPLRAGSVPLSPGVGEPLDDGFFEGAIPCSQRRSTRACMRATDADLYEKLGVLAKDAKREVDLAIRGDLPTAVEQQWEAWELAHEAAVQELGEVGTLEQGPCVECSEPSPQCNGLLYTSKKRKRQAPRAGASASVHGW